MKILSIFLFFFAGLSSYGAEKNYYDILGVDKTAEQEEIKKAHRKLIFKHHPDRNFDSKKYKTIEEYRQSKDYKEHNKKIIEIEQAYKVLSDPLKRKQYDDFGHGAFAESGASDRSSSHFKDIFKKQEEPKAHRAARFYSEKAYYLFYLILTDKTAFQADVSRSSLKHKKQQKLTRAALRELLKETGFSHLSKGALQRILKDFYIEFPDKERTDLIKIIDTTWKNAAQRRSVPNPGAFLSHPSEEQELLRLGLQRFIDHIEDRYIVQGIKGKERQAVELFHKLSFFHQAPKEYIESRNRYLELLRKKTEASKWGEGEFAELKAFEKQERADIKNFRKILQKLGLPQSAQHEILLRSYLDGLKQEWMDFQKHRFSSQPLLTEAPGERAPHGKSYHNGQYTTDQKTIELLRKTKNIFDESAYEGLKERSNPFKTNFLKGFPAQFILFQTVIGASIYRQSMTDPYFYGAERNPEMLGETLSHALSPSGIISFYIFVAVSQQLHYRLYGLGRLMDGKSLKTPWGPVSFNGKWGRLLAPGVGLGAGFFVSALFDELLRDPDLQKCSQQLFSKNGSEQNKNSHSNPCERFYLNWINSDKWQHYAVDIATLIGSGILSQKFLSYALQFTRSTALGSHALMRAGKFVGLRGSLWAGFFVQWLLFIEFHKLLDQWAGQPVKELLTAGGLKSPLIELTEKLNTGLSDLPSLIQPRRLSQTEKDQIQPSTAEILIKKIGHKFHKWSEVSSMAQMQSFGLWSRKLNQVLAPYEGSKKWLEKLFLLSHFNYGLEIASQSAQSWDSHQTISKNEQWVWNDWNTPALFFTERVVMEGNQSFFVNKYCPDVTDEMPEWKKICDEQMFFITQEKPTQLFFETSQLISKYLDSIPLNDLHYREINFMNYIGKTFNEIFSSDPNFSLQKLSYNKRLYLSKALIKSGLNGRNSLSLFNPNDVLKLQEAYCGNVFPKNKTDGDHARFYSHCLSQLIDRDFKQKIALLEYCGNQNKTETDYEHCLSQLVYRDYDRDFKQKIAFKLLSAGIYALKDLIADLGPGNHYPRSLSDYKPESLTLFSQSLFEPIRFLMDILQVYKKGEKHFLSAKENLNNFMNSSDLSDEEKEAFKQHFSLSLNFSMFAESLICGRKKSDKLSFSAPQLFPHAQIEIYNFRLSRYESLADICHNLSSIPRVSRNWEKNFHDILFDRPAQTPEARYENLYLALESLLKTNFSSSRELERRFQSLSQDQLTSIGSQVAEQLENLTDNYYKQLINFNGKSAQQKDFEDYYHEDRILFDIRNFTGKLKGLEIPLFQTHYWLNKLGRLLSAGDQRDGKNPCLSLNSQFSQPETTADRQSLNQKHLINWECFDRSAFEKMRIEVLSLLQSYHDTYTLEQGPYLTFPDSELIEQLNFTFKNKELELSKDALNQRFDSEKVSQWFGSDETINRFLILKREHSQSHLPVLMSPEIILSHILDSSVYLWNNTSQIKFIKENKTAFYDQGEEWPRLIYSVVVELNKSLDSFFAQLQPLQMKQSFEQSLSPQ